MKSLKSLFLSTSFFSLVYGAEQPLNVPAGFQSYLFAAPPEVEYVTAVSADLDGALYVSVDQNGSLGKDANRGKVVIAKDTDGDHKADSFVDFIPSVDSPRGGQIIGDTFYLIHPPYLTAYRDTTGDGVADEKKQLVEGLAFDLKYEKGADHTTNAVRMGIDGWLYIAMGDYGMPLAKGTDGTEITYRGGGVARVRPDGSELEVYVDSTRNICDVAVSPTLDLFTRDNTNDGKGWNLRVHHLLAGADMGYPRLYKNFADEHFASLADYGGGSGTGALYLHEPGLPGDFGNTLLTCDWTTGKVFYHNLKPLDGSYAPHQEVFCKLTRAIDVDVDGSSNLYMADWVGGKFNYGGEGVKVSNVYKVVPTDYQAPEVEDMQTLSDEELATYILDSSLSKRVQAQQEFLSRDQSNALVQVLADVAKSSDYEIYQRLAALYTVKQAWGEKSHRVCIALLKDDHMREYALKALTDRKTQLGSVNADTIAAHLNDANPRVRLAATLALKRLGDKSTASATKQLIALNNKEWSGDTQLDLGTKAVPHMTMRALRSIGQWQEYLTAFDSASVADQSALARVLGGLHDPAMIDQLIARLSKPELSVETRKIVFNVLARLSHKEGEWGEKHPFWSTRPDDRGPYYSVAEWEQSGKIKSAIEQHFGLFPATTHGSLIDSLIKNRIDPTKLNLQGLDTIAMAFSADKLDRTLIDVLVNAAGNKDLDWDTRAKAGEKVISNMPIEELVDHQDWAVTQMLGSWVAEGTTHKKALGIIHDFWTTRVPAVGGNVRYYKAMHKSAVKGSPEASTLAWKKILYNEHMPIGGNSAHFNKRFTYGKENSTRQEMLHPKQIGYFRAAEELGFIHQSIQDAVAAGVGWDSEAVNTAAQKAKTTIDAHLTLRNGQEPILKLGNDAATKYAMENSGDIALGEKLFNTTGCILCHNVNTEAKAKGPYLGAAGSQFERPFLIESILNPYAAMAQGFPTYQYTLKNGKGIKMGFQTYEDDNIYTIMNAAASEESFAKSSVESKKQLQISQMPPGLVNNLTLPEFTSLIDYLVSLKGE